MGRQDYFAQLRKKAPRKARAEEARVTLLLTLVAREFRYPAAVGKRILAEKDPERLMRWIERADVAASVAEVFDEPS